MEKNFSNVFVIIKFLADNNSASWVRRILVEWYGKEFYDIRHVRKAAKQAMKMLKGINNLYDHHIAAVEAEFLLQLGKLPPDIKEEA